MDCELFVIFDSIYDSSNITYANTLVLRLCKLTKNCNNDALVTLSSLKIQEPISSPIYKCELGSYGSKRPAPKPSVIVRLVVHG